MDILFSKDGTRIALEKSGSGPALVLVPGALSDRATAFPLRAHLDAHFTLFAYDRRGRGDSGDTPPYAPEREVEDVRAVIDAAGAPPFVYGHSSGAILALRAAMGGASMRALAVNEPPFIIAGTRAVPAADVAPRLQALAAAGDREGALQVFLSEQVGLPAPLLEMLRASPVWPRMLALALTTPYDCAIAGAGEFPGAALAALRLPALVIRGGASFPWIGTTARAVADAIPGAKFTVLDGQPHAPAPEALAPVLLRFFLG